MSLAWGQAKPKILKREFRFWAEKQQLKKKRLETINELWPKPVNTLTAALRAVISPKVCQTFFSLIFTQNLYIALLWPPKFIWPPIAPQKTLRHRCRRHLFHLFITEKCVDTTPVSENDDTGVVQHTFLCHNERKWEHHSENICNFWAVRYA